MNNFLAWLLFIITFIGLIFILVKFLKLRKKYLPIIDMDKELDNKNKQMVQFDNDILKLQQTYKEKREIYDKLQEKIDLLSENLEMMDVGLYEPHYHFEDAMQYKIELGKNYVMQKHAIKNKKAIVCSTQWTVEGSKVKGRQMTERNIKLTLKAFNGECDAIISKVKWNNIDKMETRIEKLYHDINKLGEPNHISIEYSYLKLKKEELWLTYEYEQKKYDEKEEQKRIREQIREEEKLQKEIEQEQKELEKKQKEFETLEKIRQEAYEKGLAEKTQEYDEKLKELQEIIDNGNRRLSEAQKTKTGHVYIISNIGSFGENIYKIGMTRRLEPQERIDELGDASVPFKFDVHAMIHSENAPELENKLHELFKTKSVNRVNYRKEFFKVSLDEIENAVKEYTNAEIEFTKTAEAREYRETQAIIKAETNSSKENTKESELPLEI